MFYENKLIQIKITYNKLIFNGKIDCTGVSDEFVNACKN